MKSLDLLVAEHVLGWTWIDVPKDCNGENEGRCIAPPGFEPPSPFYWPPKGAVSPTWFVRPWSSKIKWAWEVVEALHSKGLYVSISKDPDRLNWDVRGWHDKTNDNRFIAHAEDAPTAICLAALDAVGFDPDGLLARLTSEEGGGE